MRWFRWHRGTVSNPSFAVIATEASKPSGGGEGDRCYGAVTVTDVIAVWAVMLECASSDDRWGTCTKDQNFIAVVLRWWPDEVQSVLDCFEKHRMIERVEQGYRITNWEKYQYASDRDPTNSERQRRYRERKRADNARQTDATQTRNALPKRPDTDTDTETEKEVSVARKRARSANGADRGTRLAVDWEPSGEDRAFAAGEGIADIERTAADFRDYWHAAGGAKACKRDWPATWRRWVREEARRGNGRAQGRRQPVGIVDAFGALIAEAEAREQKH